MHYQLAMSDAVARIIGVLLGVAIFSGIAWAFYYFIVYRIQAPKPIIRWNNWGCWMVPVFGSFATCMSCTSLDMLLQQEGSLRWIGPFNLLSIAVLIWGCVGVMIYLRAQPIGVLVFRPFEQPLGDSFLDLLRKACRPYGHLDGIMNIEDASESFSFKGGTKREDLWKEGVVSILPQAKAILIDPSHCGDGLKFEIETTARLCSKQGSKAPHVVFIVRRDANPEDVKAAFTIWEEFAGPLPPRVAYGRKLLPDDVSKLMAALRPEVAPDSPGWKHAIHDNWDSHTKSFMSWLNKDAKHIARQTAKAIIVLSIAAVIAVWFIRQLILYG